MTVKVALDDWQAASQHVVGNYQVDSVNSGWFVDVDGGMLRFGWGDGTATPHTATSSVIPVQDAVDGEPLWLRVTFDPEPGTVSFSYRVADTGSYTTLNTVNTEPSHMVNPTALGYVGKAHSAGPVDLQGDVFSVLVEQDQSPTTVWAIDFTACSAPAQSCSQGGRTWVANAAAQIRAPGIGGRLTTFTHDPAGSGGPHAVATRTTPTATTSYTYDPAGNMVGSVEGAVTTTLGWDARNRLGSWSDGTDDYSFSYDASGERVSRSDGTTTAVFLGDVEIEGSTARSYYSFGGQTVAVRTTTGSTTSLELVLTDHLRSTQVTFNPVTGLETGRRVHRPYGDIRNQTGAMPGDRGYTGQHADPTGLMYYGARYYAPDLMTFVSADTIIPDPGSAVGLNRYAYVAGNPIRYSDPTGNSPMLPLHEGGTPGSRSTVTAFDLPKLAGVGTVTLRLFIARPSSPGTGLRGDNRDFYSVSGQTGYRAEFRFNFDTGVGSVAIAPSCGSGGGCSQPLRTRVVTPQGEIIWHGTPAVRMGEYNRVSVAIADGQLQLKYHLSVSRDPGWAWGIANDVSTFFVGESLGTPSIDGIIIGSFVDGGVVGGGWIENYPSVEIVQTTPGGDTIILYEHREKVAWSALWGGPEHEFTFGIR